MYVPYNCNDTILVQSIDSESKTCDIGKLPENCTKNRYTNILPCKYFIIHLYCTRNTCIHKHTDDFSRVKLQQREEDESDYINSSYIDV